MTEKIWPNEYDQIYGIDKHYPVSMTDNYDNNKRYPLSIV